MNQSGTFMKYLRAIASIILLVCLDQYTKYMVVTHLELYTYHPIIGNLFGLYYLQNNGMAWGMFQQKQIFFLIFTILILIAAVYVYVKLLKDTFFRPLNICIIFLVSGAIGNMIDRMFRGEFLHGGVVDFLYIKCINFPVFNVADMYVTMSIFVIILLMFLKYRNVDFESIIGKDTSQNESLDENSQSTASSMDEEDIAEKLPEYTKEQMSISDEIKSVDINDMFLNEEEEDD
jgi:signal peptidase II